MSNNDVDIFVCRNVIRSNLSFSVGTESRLNYTRRLLSSYIRNMFRTIFLLVNRVRFGLRSRSRKDGKNIGIEKRTCDTE